MFDKKHAEDVFFCQTDMSQEWVHAPYWEGIIRNEGCGMISLTACINVLTGKDYHPLDIYRMRDEAGIDQSTVVTKDGKSVCGGDAQFQFNEVNGRLFGIKSLPLERSVEAFEEALGRDNTVIWASSRNVPFHDKTGEEYHRKPGEGHVIMFWKYEDGIFYAKDCHYLKELGNNVPYTEEEMADWLSGGTYQQFAITLV